MSGSNAIRLAQLAFVTLLASGCTDEVIDTLGVETPYKIHNPEHNSQRLIFLSREQSGYVYAALGPNGLSVVHTDEDGTHISSPNVDFTKLQVATFPDSTVQDYAVDLPIGSVIKLDDFYGQLTFADGRVGADPAIQFAIEIRFGASHEQMAHRFLPPASAGYYYYPSMGEYDYQDYVQVPFSAWDVTVNPHRQLMVSFRDQARDGHYNLVRKDSIPPMETFSLEYIFVHDIDYNSIGPDPGLSASGLEVTETIWFCPILSDSYIGTWVPASTQIVGIRSVDDLPFSIKNISHYEMAFVEEMGEYNLLSTGVHKGHVDVTALLRLNDGLIPIVNEHKRLVVRPPSAFFEGSAHMYKTSDGGFVVTQPYYAFETATSYTRALKVSGSGVTEFEATKTGNVSFFIEDKGKYFLADAFDVYRFDAHGVQQAFTASTNFSQMMTVASTDQGVVGLHNGTSGPELVLFNDDFSAAARTDFDPFDSPDWFLNPDHKVELYGVGDILFFAGPGPAGFFVGKVDLGGHLAVGSQLPFFPHKLGFPMLQNRTLFNDDGSAAHVVVLQTTAKSTDVLFFRTDENFLIIEE